MYYFTVTDYPNVKFSYCIGNLKAYVRTKSGKWKVFAENVYPATWHNTPVYWWAYQRAEEFCKKYAPKKEV